MGKGREFVMPLNPQQQKFKDVYIDPSSATFSNAYRSALAAGYEENYAVNITAQGNEWFCEILRDKEMLDSAEKALREAVEFNVVEEDGINVGIAKVKTDVAKFIAETIGKEKYSKRIEQKNVGGLEIELTTQVKQKLDQYAPEVQTSDISTVGE